MTLLSLAIEAVKSYNPQIVTPSTHIEQFCTNIYKLDEQTCNFIADIILGLERYKLLFQITIDGFYRKYKSQLISEDKHLYKILAYLFIIQPNVISKHKLKLILVEEKTQHHMYYKLLKFLFFDYLDWLSNQWSLIYDVDYISNVLIKQMNNWQSYVESIIADLNINDNNRTQQFRIRKTHKKTKIIPFKFKNNAHNSKTSVISNKSQQQLITETNTINNIPKSKPIVSTTLAQLESEHERRRKKVFEETKNRHLKAKAPRLTENKRKPREKSPKPKILANPLPKYPKAPKLNYTTADILRMDAIFRKRQEDEAAAIRAYEFALRDASEFERWQEEEKLKEDEKRRQEIEARRLELLRAALDAQNAVEENIQQKIAEVKEMKIDLAERLSEKERLETEALFKAQERATAIIQERQQVQEARKCIIVNRKKRAKKLLHEKKKRERIRQRKRQTEMKEKRKLIQQIQAMEKIATERAKQIKVIDPSETSGMNLMSEMSLLELKERLVQLKLREERMVHKKRETILRRREDQRRVLQAKLERIERIRSMQSMDAGERRIKSRDKTHSKNSSVSKREALKLAKRISEQRSRNLSHSSLSLK